VQILRYFKSKYLSFFSARRVFRHAGIDVKPLLLENRIYIVALTPELQRVLIYSIIVFLYYSSTTELYIIPHTSKGVSSEV